MDQLSDLSWLHIFSFLSPKEWIVISQVCTKWKNLLSELWNNVNTISNIFNSNLITQSKPITIINQKEVMDILQHCGSFIVSASLDNSFDGKYQGNIRIGNYLFYIDYLKVNYLISVMSKVCDKIEELDLKNIDKYTKIHKLFTANKDLKRLVLDHCKLSYIFTKNITLRRVEDLSLVCDSSCSIYGFEWCCPNVTKFNFYIEDIDLVEINVVMKDMFSFLSRVKILHLCFHSYRDKNPKLQALSRISNFIDLQELTIKAENPPMKLPNGFMFKLTEKCRKLKMIHLESIRLDIDSFEDLLQRPSLETITLINPVKKFELINPSLLPLLKKLTIEFTKKCTVDLENLCEVLDQMPALSKLTVGGLKQEIFLQLIVTEIIRALSEDKIIIVGNYGQTVSHQKVKICKTKDFNVNFEDNSKVYEIKVGEYRPSATHIDIIKSCLEKWFPNSFVLEYEDKIQN